MEHRDVLAEHEVSCEEFEYRYSNIQRFLETSGEEPLPPLEERMTGRDFIRRYSNSPETMLMLRSEELLQQFDGWTKATRGELYPEDVMSSDRLKNEQLGWELYHTTYGEGENTWEDRYEAFQAYASAAKLPAFARRNGLSYKNYKAEYGSNNSPIAILLMTGRFHEFKGEERVKDLKPTN